MSEDMENMINKITNADCFDVLPQIGEKTIDLIICDPPYNLTNLKWDGAIDLDLLWRHYKKIIKDNGAIIFFGSQPFSSDVILSNREMFRYQLIWNKIKGSNFQLCNVQPLKAHEEILIFYKKKPHYTPQMVQSGIPYKTKDGVRKKKSELLRGLSSGEVIGDNLRNAGFIRKGKDNEGERFPTSILTFKKDNVRRSINKTQKPLSLIEYLIKSYTVDGSLVLDSFAGSCVTGLASQNLNRKWICIEKDDAQCRAANVRILGSNVI